MGWSVKFNLRIVIIAIALVVIAIIALFGDYSNSRRDIYFRTHSKISLAYIFGYLPNDYQNEYNEEVIEDEDKYSLVRISYNRSPNENHGYILLVEEKNSNRARILLDYDSLFYEMKGIEDLLSSQIDLSLFNEYLKYRKGFTNDELIQQYCLLVSQFDTSSFRIVNTQNQIYKLKRVGDAVRDSNECYVYHCDKFEPNFEMFKYIWFEEYGLFEMTFQREEKQLVSVSDTFIFGPLGLSVTGTVPCE